MFDEIVAAGTRRAPLAARPGATRPLSLAYWHHPRYSSASTAKRVPGRDLGALYETGSSGARRSRHSYERFAAVNASGISRRARGHLVVVGTGGRSSTSSGTSCRRAGPTLRVSGVLLVAADARWLTSRSSPSPWRLHGHRQGTCHSIRGTTAEHLRSSLAPDLGVMSMTTPPSSTASNRIGSRSAERQDRRGKSILEKDSPFGRPARDGPKRTARPARGP